MAASMSGMLIVLFTCFTYSGGIPLLNVICLCVILCKFWVNKHLLLKLYKIPPRYTEKFNDKVIRLLPYALIFHCIFSLLALGSEAIFPSGFEIDTDDEGA